MTGAPAIDRLDAPGGAEALLSAEGLRQRFRMGDSAIEVLRGASIHVRAGEFVAIEGRSGSGKSTLLHLLGLLDAPVDGRIVYSGRDVASLPARQRCAIRNEQFGFVFQFYHLLPELNVLENTMLAAMVRHGWLAFRLRRGELKARAVEILRQLGVDHRLGHRPAQLSGGERQRVAIARALMNRPRVLYADEPTGNLDVETGGQIMRVLEALHREGQTIVMVTHDRAIARQADRVLVLHEGRLRQA